MTERCDTPPDEALPASALPLPHEVLVWRGMKATPTVVLIDAFVVGDQLEKALIEETARRRRAEVLLFATQQAYVREHEAVVQSETALPTCDPCTTPKGCALFGCKDQPSPDDKPERQVLIDAIGRTLRLHEGHTFDVLAKRIADEVLSLRSAGGRSMREYQERSDLIADFETSTPSATALRELAERCRPAVAHDARLRERDVDSDKYAHTYKPVLKAEAERAAKLLDDIDAILGARSVAPHRSGGPVADGTPKPESASPDRTTTAK